MQRKAAMSGCFEQYLLPRTQRLLFSICCIKFNLIYFQFFQFMILCVLPGMAIFGGFPTHCIFIGKLASYEKTTLFVALLNMAFCASYF